MTNLQKKEIATFLEENNLRFTDGRRNSDATILSGYILFLGINSLAGVGKIIKENCPYASDFKNELARVFDYAQDNNYGDWWSTSDAKKQYKF